MSFHLHTQTSLISSPAGRGGPPPILTSPPLLCLHYSESRYSRRLSGDKRLRGVLPRSPVVVVTTETLCASLLGENPIFSYF